MKTAPKSTPPNNSPHIPRPLTNKSTSIPKKRSSSTYTSPTTSKTKLSSRSTSSPKPKSTPYRSALEIYLEQLSLTPLLSQKDELSLAKKALKGNSTAREKLIKANLRLVVKIASDYANLGLPIADLISEGNIGLMKGIERFDPSKGVKLSTYAAWWIKQCIKRALANQSRTIRLPSHLIEKISNLRKAEHSLRESLHREPTNQELSQSLNLPIRKVAHIRAISKRPTSLDSPFDESDSHAKHLSDILQDDLLPSPSQSLSHKSTLNDLHSFLKLLKPKDSEIIHKRFGLNDSSPQTLEQIGSKVGLTRERVRQKQNAIIQLIRRYFHASESPSSTPANNPSLSKIRIEIINEFLNNPPSTH